ncbi:putative transporter [Scheffersomyces xylosifermentans]|uniref:putative transporter n=1 Tax=Scheffersomyces xylosifermentans TaxID=1304137 RepID=UPI00315C6685
MTSINNETRAPVKETNQSPHNSSQTESGAANNNDTVSSSYNNQKEYDSSDDAASTGPEAFVGGDLELGVDEDVIPIGGDELSRYESNTNASRSLSRRMTNADELIEAANKTDEPLPKMGNDRPYPPALPDRSPYVVAYDGPNDPIHPHNFPLWKKVAYSASVGMAALSVSMGSALFAEGSAQLVEQFHIGSVTATLGTSLFVLGFASGPIIYGPLSELFGRKIVMIISSFGYMCFSFAVATSKDIQSIMICRFFAGFVGAAPLVVAAAVMADLFSAKARGTAIAVFAMILFGGPMLAPIIGGFIVKNESLGWRWTSYLCGIIGALSLFMNSFILEETHHAIILVRKAEILRRRTGNWGIFAPQEEISLSMKEIVEKNITRPLVMLFTEPILFLITLYNAFIYGMLYLFLTAIPLIFMGQYHFAQGIAELPYLAMLIGTFLGGLVIIYFEKRYNIAMDNNGGKPVPEERLPPMMIGSFFFAGGIFWLGWAGAYPQNVHWMVPTVGAGFVGFGLILIFLPCMNYIIDCYLFFAASALAGNTFLRSAFGAVFPLFARQMFVNMKIQWASTLLGCIAIIMIPVPFLFYKFGRTLRDKSKFAFVL